MNTKFYDNSIFAGNLKRMLEKKDMTAAELSRQLGVSKSAVSDWANGVSLPRTDKVDAMCKIFNCTREDFSVSNYLSPIPITGTVPIYGTIAAGSPCFADENIIGYESTTIKHPEEMFGLIVHGDSMKNVGIVDGAIVILHKQDTAENGQIVACLVNDEEATLKRFRQQGDSIFLMPENNDYDPIIVSAKDFESGDAKILGVLKELVVKF